MYVNTKCINKSENHPPSPRWLQLELHETWKYLLQKKLRHSGSNSPNKILNVVLIFHVSIAGICQYFDLANLH